MNWLISLIIEQCGPKLLEYLIQQLLLKYVVCLCLRTLEDEFGYFEISDEDNVGHEEMYWRLVRPNSPTDVGPLHADAWFWDLGHGVTPSGYKRVKVWIAIYCTPGKDGFKFVPGSHKRQWPYDGELRDGMTKPKIGISEKELDVVIFNSKPGEAIVFNDQLLHGGAVGKNETRVSLEFTMFVKNEKLLYLNKTNYKSSLK